MQPCFAGESLEQSLPAQEAVLFRLLLLEEVKQKQNPSFLVNELLLFRDPIVQQIMLLQVCLSHSLFFLLSLSHFSQFLFSPSLRALCQIAVWLLEADTAAWL